MINQDELQAIVDLRRTVKVNFRFEYFAPKQGIAQVQKQWYWRMRASNGRIIADGSEGYATKSNVKRAISRVTRHLQPGSFRVTEAKK